MTALAGELRKLPAFVRRDFLVAWSYRMSFASSLVDLASQALVFAFIGKLIDPDELPTFQGKEVMYLEFAAIGIALGAFIQFGLQRVSTAIRNEQLIGTLESLLVTPTRTATLQIGSVFFDVIYNPLQTALFLVAVALGFGLGMEPAGILPATAVLLVFIPFVWGLGVLSAAATLTFRRGTKCRRPGHAPACVRLRALPLAAARRRRRWFRVALLGGAKRPAAGAVTAHGAVVASVAVELEFHQHHVDTEPSAGDGSSDFLEPDGSSTTEDDLRPTRVCVSSRLPGARCRAIGALLALYGLSDVVVGSYSRGSGAR
jgi:hypothetical protein